MARPHSATFCDASHRSVARRYATFRVVARRAAVQLNDRLSSAATQRASSPHVAMHRNVMPQLAYVPHGATLRSVPSRIATSRATT